VTTRARTLRTDQPAGARAPPRAPRPTYQLLSLRILRPTCQLLAPRPAYWTPLRTVAGRFGLANLRGDVSSVPASLHAALGIKLYRLVNLVLDERLSRASWPAWNSVLLKLRSSSEAMKQRALFRLPRIYRTAVCFLVGSAILADSFILGSQTARLIAGASTHPEWRPHAYFGAICGLILNVVLSWFVSLLLLALSNMENPFASGWLDLCGLSYVCAASEMSLRMVTGADDEPRNSERFTPDGEGASSVMRMFQRLDTDGLLHGVGRDERDAEEDDENVDDDDGGE